MIHGCMVTLVEGVDKEDSYIWGPLPEFIISYCTVHRNFIYLFIIITMSTSQAKTLHRKGVGDLVSRERKTLVV